MASRAHDKQPMPILATSESGFEAAFRRFARRYGERDEAVVKTARKIVERVRDGGDRELLALVRKHDSPKVQALEVTRDEWDAGVERVNPADRAALGKAGGRALLLLVRCTSISMRDLRRAVPALHLE